MNRFRRKARYSASRDSSAASGGRFFGAASPRCLNIPASSSFFDGVREFHPGVRKQLHAVVLKGIVRGGDNHAGLKIVLANKTSPRRSGNYAGKRNRGASPRETAASNEAMVRAGFASVHADEDMRCPMFAIEIRSKSASRGVKSGVIQRRRARDARIPSVPKNSLAM